MKKTIALVLALTMLLALCACGGGTSAAPETTTEPVSATAAPTAEPVKAEPVAVFTDMTGREIALEKYPERIVALTASCCEILYAVGAGDLLVARGTYCDYPEQVLELPTLGSGSDTNLEDVIGMEPDMVLIDTMAQTEEQIAALEAAGIAVVVTTERGIDGIYEAVRLIGRAVDHADEAETVITDMQTRLADLAAKAEAMEIPEEERPSIYFEVTPPYFGYGIWAAGEGSFMDELCGILGLRNIFADAPQWAQVSEEQVIEANPDYIVTITMYYGEEYESAEAEIMARPGWENIPAVQNGAILLFAHDELSRPAPRLADGAEMLFDFVYGEADAENAA
ncbi:MAG: ABC transporter substrate-binding protein [Oscillospiraceae bacterium]|nr:ABC transporter substrate-binding protein [Oscillospiraceae bacterium]